MFKSYETFSFLHTHIYTYIYLFNFTYRIPESQKTLNRDTLSNIPLHEHPHSSPRSYFSLNPWIQVDQNCIGPRFLWELREEGAAGRRQGNRIQSQITTVHRSSRPLGLMRSMRACVTVYLSTMEGVFPPLSLSSVFLFFARDQQSFVSNWSRGGDGSSPLLFACLGCLSDTTTRPIKDTLSRVDWMEGVVNNGLVTAIVSLRIFGLVSILLVGFFYSNSWQHNV